MKYDKNVWGTPKEFSSSDLYNLNIQVVNSGRATAKQLFNDNVISFNQKWNESICYAGTTSNYWKYYKLIDGVNRTAYNAIYKPCGLTLAINTVYPSSDLKQFANFPNNHSKNVGHDREMTYLNRTCFDVEKMWEKDKDYIDGVPQTVVDLNTSWNYICGIDFKKLIFSIHVCCHKEYDNTHAVPHTIDVDYETYRKSKSLQNEFPVCYCVYLRAFYNKNTLPHWFTIQPQILGQLTCVETATRGKLHYNTYNNNFPIIIGDIRPFDFNHVNDINPVIMQSYCGNMVNYSKRTYTFTETGKDVELYVPLVDIYSFNLIDVFTDLGVFISTNDDDAYNMNYDGQVYCKDLDKEGKPSGTPKKAKTTQQFNYDDGTDYIDKGGFVGTENVDPNSYTDKIDLVTPQLTGINVFNRSFAINSKTVEDLADYLWNADDSIFTEIINGLKLMGANPINAIINLKLFPFDIAEKCKMSAVQNIVIGRTNTHLNGIKLEKDVNSVIDLGSCSFYKYFKNFLDYEPHTHAQMYIPYVGVIPISTSEFMGHEISVKMIVDYITGACTAIVYRDTIPYIYKNGCISVDIPITGDNAVEFSKNAIRNILGMSQGKSDILAGTGQAVQGNLVQGVQQAEKGMGESISSCYNFLTKNVMYQTAGTSTPAVSLWQPKKCYFIINTPITQVPSNYGQSVGYACELTDTLKNMKGFTVISNPKINFKCSKQEEEMLNSVLQAGVYIE